MSHLSDYLKNLYLQRKQQAEESLFRNEIPSWADNMRSAIENFCRLYIAIKIDDDNITQLIIDGKRDLHKVFEVPLRQPPHGKLLIKYMLSESDGRLVLLKKPTSRQSFLYSLYDKLSEIAHGLSMISFKEAQTIAQKLQDLDITLQRLSLLSSSYEVVDDDTLRKSLALSSKAANEGYREASSYMRIIKQSNVEAERIILDCIKSMHDYHIQDGELVVKVQEQLNAIVNDFRAACAQTENQLLQKKKETNSFNITLFGRTMTGKSTLMEILTHGDGSSIGYGGQRTTRDVRRYEWKGMTITDVPGIDAYDGAEDDSIAERAVINADLVLFLITAGQPESTEADWLCKILKKDKAVICICNYKTSLSDEKRLQRFLANPGRLKEEMDITGIVSQFHEFLQKELPNTRIFFYVTHLLAKFYSLQPRYKEQSTQLAELSQFDSVEKEIIKTVNNNAVFFRRRCFLSIIDIPLYEQANSMFEFSAKSLEMSQRIEDNIKKLNNWQQHDAKDKYKAAHESITFIFNQVRNRIPGFIEKYLENPNINEEWNNLIDSIGINNHVQHIVQELNDYVKNGIQDMFSDLNVELNLTLRMQGGFVSQQKIINWKRFWGWTGAGLGIVGTILGLCGGPIAWIFGGLAAACWLGGWFSDSREKKLRSSRIQMTERLHNQVDKMEKNAHAVLTKHYINDIANGIQKEAYNRFRILQRSILCLTNAQRKLALEYIKLHTEISTRLIKILLEEMHCAEDIVSTINFVARVPNKQIVIVLKEDVHPSIQQTLKRAIKNRIGKEEEVNILTLNNFEPNFESIKSIFSFFRLRIRISVREINGNTIVYVKKQDYTDRQLDCIDLIQQIFKIHILFRNYE